jgi:hypothetical protein
MESVPFQRGERERERERIHQNRDISRKVYIREVKD